jgi:hypothetical protein
MSSLSPSTSSQNNFSDDDWINQQRVTILLVDRMRALEISKRALIMETADHRLREKQTY